MKSKFYTLTFLFILFPLLMFSQDPEFFCGTEDDNTPDPVNVYSHATDDATLDAYEPIVFNVYFWGINQDDGSSEHRLTEDETLQMIADLNIEFNKFNVFFKYYGMDHINSTTFYKIYYDPHPTSDRWDFTSFLNANPEYKTEEAIDVYIPFDTDGALAWADPWSSRMRIVGNSVEVKSAFVIIHEMGHILNLKHPFAGWDTNNCEHVTRITTDGNYNADIAGDRVVDTAAQDTMITDIDFDNCIYIENELDCEGTPFSIFPEDVKNYMSYGGVRQCGDRFSKGQQIRVREFIADEIDIDGKLYRFLNDVSSLYEPYKGEYYVDGPTLTDRPLFQPGFYYVFVKCGSNYPEPSDYDDISFSYNTNTVLAFYEKDELDYYEITHPNHSAILIKHLIGDVFFPQPRKCYDNFNLAATGGTVLKFNDNVLNNNVTIIPQDSTSINSQNLINDLPSGLYKIEKTYNDGAVEETVIIKEQ
jgi:hypothetical protein